MPLACVGAADPLPSSHKRAARQTAGTHPFVKRIRIQQLAPQILDKRPAAASTVKQSGFPPELCAAERAAGAVRPLPLL